VILNAHGPSIEIPSPQEYPLHVDTSPYSHVTSYSLSSPSPSENSKASNQVDKKKKKRKIKKKKNKQGTKLPTTPGHVGSNQPVTFNQARNIDEVHKPSKTTHNPKFPCRLCKGDHFLWDFPGLTKVLEVWFVGPHQPMSSSSGHHAGNKPSTSDSDFG
jgi:hypothetical protein